MFLSDRHTTDGPQNFTIRLLFCPFEIRNHKKEEIYVVLLLFIQSNLEITLEMHKCFNYYDEVCYICNAYNFPLAALTVLWTFAKLI